MSRNPFLFQHPVIEPGTAFFRNEQAVNSIVNGLLLGNYYTLLGPRCSGISSMIFDILHTARVREKHCQCLYIDLQALEPALSKSSLFERIVEIGDGWPIGTGPPCSEVTSCAQFHEALVGMVRDRPARLIVAFDDLDSESLSRDTVRRLVRCARALYNQRLIDPEFHKISVLIGGAHNPYELSTGSGSPFNIAEKYWLPDLTTGEVEHLIHRGEQLSGLLFDEAAIARIAAATEGDKYFVQRLCHLCVQEAEALKTNIVTEKMVSGQIERLVTADYRQDKCFASLVRSLKREADLTEVLVEMLDGNEVVTSECQADAYKLQLTGILKVERGCYRFRNEVYERFMARREEIIRDGWKIHAQAKKLVGLHDVALGIAAVIDPEAALKEAAWMVLRACGADTVAVYLFERAIDRFSLKTVASREELCPMNPLLERDGIAREVIATQQARLAEDLEICNARALSGQPCSCIWLPLTVSNRALGTLFVAFHRHHDFSETYEMMGLEIMASHLAVAITRTELLHTLKENMATLNSLYQASTRLRTSLYPEDVLEAITASLHEMFGLTTCTVGLLDEAEEHLDFVAYKGLSGPTTRLIRDLPPDLWRRVRREGQRTFIPELAKYPELAKQLERQDLVSFAILPLQGKERFLGLLTMSSTQRLNLADRDWSVITALADQAAVAIENAQLYQEVYQARKALDDSLKVLTHELRAEPAFVTNTIDNLRAGKLGDLNEKQRDRLEKARRRLDDHHRLIDNINVYGRLKGGKIIPRQETVQLAQVLQAVTTSYRGEAKRRGLVLKTRGLRKLPPIKADKGMVQVIVASLLDNAIKFTPHGGRISVEGAVVRDGVCITVEDSGPGIPSEERAKVFDEYYQGEPNSVRVKKGAGLGLYIARRFVEMHGGRIAVVDKEDPGARIKVILPGAPMDPCDDQEEKHVEAAGNR